MKWIIEDKKIKATEGLDGMYHLEIEAASCGYIHIIGDNLGECIAKLLDMLEDSK